MIFCRRWSSGVRRETAGTAGAQRLSWHVVPTALGHQANAAGAGKQEGDIVMWTSSEAAQKDSWVPRDLTRTEGRRGTAGAATGVAGA